MQAFSYKNLLIGLTQDPPLPSAALEFGLDLAQKCAARVTVEVDATYDAPLDMVTYEGAAMIEAANARFQLAAEEAGETARRHASTSGVPCTVLSSRETYAALVRGFATTARTFDVAILDARETATAPSSRYVEEALMSSGRPVIVVPPEWTSRPLERAVVAWDGGAEAARAVNEALPLLAGMRSVEVVCARSPDLLRDQIPGLEIEQHLRRHGVEATLVGLPIIEKSPVKTVIAHVRNIRADLVVMGGFSHWWLRELVLGGMTKTMLDDVPAVLFLSH
jgi:nucleotide-binding universal stress UspA family protein